MPSPVYEADPLVYRRGLTARQWRDITAITLIVLGVVGLVATAWAWNPLVGCGLMSVAIIALGAFLGLDR